MKRPRGKIAAAFLAFVLATGAATRAQAQTFTILYSFTGGSDGRQPEGGLLLDAAGNLYGTTVFGGTSNAGTVFKVGPSGNETVLHRFSSGTAVDGATPVAGLIMDTAGNLYGTTQAGTTFGFGIVFKLDPGGNETVLHSFTGYPSDGAEPQATLVMDGAGNLYGTTVVGGSGNCRSSNGTVVGCGTVFKLTSSGNVAVLCSFTGGSDGADPFAGLVMDAAGNLYGTTPGGGSSNCTSGCGIVFRLDPSGKETVLHSFTGSITGGSDGAFPEASLIMDAAGNLYGTTSGGGSGNCSSNGTVVGCGTVFKLDPSGNETVLHRFTGGSDGAFPGASLIMDKAGNLYGTTMVGGAFGLGTAFKLDTSGHETVLHSFTNAGGSGYAPSSGLVMDAAGSLYGTTQAGGAFGFGTVFKLSSPKPVGGDFDGDGKADVAVFRPTNGTWYVIPSNTPSNFLVQQWGTAGDIPVRGDYDGDGKTDFAVFRPSNGTWFIIPSSNPSAPIVQQWGTQGDIPVPGDYDGDGKTDFAVFRPSNGTWYIIPSSNPSAVIVKQWGTQGDMPVPGDYDGDGKTDFAVWRPSSGTWFIIPSSNPGAPVIQQWGAVGDIPVPVDYDGDRKTDIAVWRPSNGVWFIIPSATPTNFTVTQWGISTDVPLQKPIGQ